MAVTRRINYAQALLEAQAQALEENPNVYIMGLGVPGPSGTFGTTTGLAERFGPDRVMDMPNSEQGMTGVALGTTVTGMRPILVHIRVDFSILAMDQIVNQVAKWHFMYGGKLRAPMVFRVIIGRGWGQGPQHSQSLQSWFAHVPGLKVVMPTTPRDAKGMLISAIRDDSPVFFFEHRWLYQIEGDVPIEMYDVPLDKARVARSGTDVTLVATSYMVLEALRAADVLSGLGINAEVIDLRAISPMDHTSIISSVEKTGALVAIDTGGIAFGVTSEIVSVVTEHSFPRMRFPPRRIGLPHIPSPASPALADAFFPRARSIIESVMEMFNIDLSLIPPETPPPRGWHDVPDMTFTGPY